MSMHRLRLRSELPLESLILLMFCFFLWGSAYPFLKMCMPLLGIGPDDIQAKLAFAGIRFFIGAMILGIGYVVQVQDKRALLQRLDRGYLSRVALLGLFQTTLAYAMFYTGVGRVMSAKAAIIGGMGSIFLVIGAHILYANDRLSTRRVIGIAIGFLGLIILNLGGLLGAASGGAGATSSIGTTGAASGGASANGSGMGLWNFSLGGEGLLILVAINSAFTSLWAKQLSKKIAPIELNIGQMLIGSVILLILGAPQIAPLIQALMARWQLMLALVYLSLVSAAGFSIYYHILQHNKAGSLGTYRFLIPFFGVVLSILFVPGESWSWQIGIALTCIIAGIILS